MSEQYSGLLSELAEAMSGSEIIRLAWEINGRIKNGEKVFNMTIGDFNPRHFPVPEALKKGIQEAYENNQTNYPPAEGIPELREAVHQYLKRWGSFDVPKEEIQISGGARPLVYATFLATTDPGDKVIFGVPSWNNNYFCDLTRTQPVMIHSGASEFFLPTAELIAPHLKDASLLALCSPLNPSGTVFSETELRKICLLVLEENAARKGKRRPLYLMYDQVYWTLTFGETRHVHPVALFPEMKPYTIYIDAISKSFAATGVRVGWAWGPAFLMEKMKDMLGQIGAWAPRPEQYATAYLLSRESEVERYHQWISSELSFRLNKLFNGFEKLRQEGLPIEAIAPQAALYLSVKFPILGLTDAKGKILSEASDIFNFLLNEAGFAALPFKVFGAADCDEWFRVSVGTIGKEDIDQLLLRLRTALLTFRDAPMPLDSK
jgi:aspartate aminotransferase